MNTSDWIFSHCVFFKLAQEILYDSIKLIIKVLVSRITDYLDQTFDMILSDFLSDILEILPGVLLIDRISSWSRWTTWLMMHVVVRG